MIAPRHLQEISELIQTKKFFEVIKLKCTCGHTHFKVYENVESDTDGVNLKYNEIIRENYKLYWVKRNLFGKIVQRVECVDTPFKKQRKIIKVHCDACGKEYIIFDNYMHGYDAIMNYKKESNTILNSGFTLCHSNALTIYIQLYQDASYEELQEEFNELNFEDYLCSFSSILIYGFNSKSKRINIHSEETA